MHVPCDFSVEPDGDKWRLKCNRCDAVRISATAKLVRRCDVKLATPAKPRQRLRRYVRALRKWIKAGRPTRSKEEVAKLLAICETCDDHFHRRKKSCKLCGCRMRGPAFANKLKMATESCPAKPARWRAER